MSDRASGGEPHFFATPAEFRAWLESNHDREAELWVGFYKKGSGRPSITWPEAVDEALCVGWIDGLRKSIDAESYRIRFTPRKPRSTWSAVNVRRVAELECEGRMRPSGREAFARRAEQPSGTYSYEQRGEARLWPEAEARFRAEPEAWAFFQARPAWYRKSATWWVVSARRPETRERRLETLMSDCAAGRVLGRMESRKGIE